MHPLEEVFSCIVVLLSDIKGFELKSALFSERELSANNLYVHLYKHAKVGRILVTKRT